MPIKTLKFINFAIVREKPETFKYFNVLVLLLWSYKMIQNDIYEPNFYRKPEYVAGRPYQSRLYQDQSHLNKPLYQNQLETPGAYYMGNPQAYSSVGATGFAALPGDLGGEVSGTRSRFSGVPNW